MKAAKSERPEPNAYVIELESALASIMRECEFAIEEPQVVFTSICRIATVTRRALDQSSVRG